MASEPIGPRPVVRTVGGSFHLTKENRLLFQAMYDKLDKMLQTFERREKPFKPAKSHAQIAAELRQHRRKAREVAANELNDDALNVYRLFDEMSYNQTGNYNEELEGDFHIYRLFDEMPLNQIEDCDSDGDSLNVYHLFDEKSDVDEDELNTYNMFEEMPLKEIEVCGKVDDVIKEELEEDSFCIYNLFDEMPEGEIKRCDTIYDISQLFDEMPQREIRKYDEFYEVYQLFDEISDQDGDVLNVYNLFDEIPDLDGGSLNVYHMFDEMSDCESLNASHEKLGESNCLFGEVRLGKMHLRMLLPPQKPPDNPIGRSTNVVGVENASVNVVFAEYDKDTVVNGTDCDGSHITSIMSHKELNIWLYIPLLQWRYDGDLALVCFGIHMDIPQREGLMFKPQLDRVRSSIQASDFRLLKLEQVPYMKSEIPTHKEKISTMVPILLSGLNFVSTMVPVVISGFDSEGGVVGENCEVYARQKMEEFSSHNLGITETRANTFLKLLLEHTSNANHPKCVNNKWRVLMFESSFPCGMQRLQNYISSVLVTNREEIISYYKDHKLLLVDKKATNVGDLSTTFACVIIGGYHVLVLTRYIEQEAMNKLPLTVVGSTVELGHLLCISFGLGELRAAQELTKAVQKPTISLLYTDWRRVVRLCTMSRVTRTTTITPLILILLKILRKHNLKKSNNNLMLGTNLAMQSLQMLFRLVPHVTPVIKQIKRIYHSLYHLEKIIANTFSLLIGRILDIANLAEQIGNLLSVSLGMKTAIVNKYRYALYFLILMILMVGNRKLKSLDTHGLVVPPKFSKSKYVLVACTTNEGIDVPCELCWMIDDKNIHVLSVMHMTNSRISLDSVADTIQVTLYPCLDRLCASCLYIEEQLIVRIGIHDEVGLKALCGCEA